MKKRKIIIAAKFLSSLFAPFYLPLVGLLALFVFTYLSLLPWMYKLFLLLLVCFFTLLLPRFIIKLYRHYYGWSLLELGHRERRVIPYVISIVCYLLCYYFMALAHVPHFIGSIVIAALVVQIACAIVNLFFKISIHTAAIGGVVGSIMAFSAIFGFNPVWWLCCAFVLAGVVGTSRMILRQHSLHEVIFGFLLGVLCAFGSVLLF